ncbi:MAG: O-acetylhomoserine aminocarboxypropyltransferase [Hyphomicrobiaceae bacterium]|nr:O-acetylhomoserine aminocarboxypropyltransferase [Hyphomicrobiaceae bacterium]
MSDKPHSFDTLAVHAGAAPDPATGARITPIYQTTAFAFNDADHAARLFGLQEFGNIYTRIMNPTQDVLEKRVAALEGGTAALAAASGHGAQLLVLHNLMQPGTEIIAARQLYGGSVNQLGHSIKNFGWSVKWADVEDPASFEALVNDNTRAIFIESIANPAGLVTDIEAIARVAEQAGVPLIVDNTMATPYLCRPFDHGANIITHSLTKFLGGHGNSMGGILIDGGNFDWMASDKFPMLSQPNDSYHGMVIGDVFGEAFGHIAFAIAARVLSLRDLGPCIAPMNAFLILNGIETLPLRMQRHCENALTVAKWLDADDRIDWVSYAGLPGSANNALAQKYTPKGPGSVFSFGLKDGFESGKKLVNNVKLFTHLANLGDTRSLIIHPASTTHSQLDEDALKKAGAGPEVIRVSVGIEDASDLIADIDQALG